MIFYNNKIHMSFDRHLHLELCRIARELNSIFGMQITFEMLSYFATISTMCYALFVMLVQKDISIYIYGLILSIGFPH